jgi:putative membrane protein
MKPGLRRVLVFTALYMAGFGYLAFQRGSTEFIFYFFTMFVFIALVGFAHLSVRFSTGVLFALSLWGFLHMAGGTVPSPRASDGEVLYAWYLIPGAIRYDMLVHAFGFGAAATACWQALRRHLRHTSHVTYGVVIIVVLTGMGLGTVNEMVEYIATKIDPNHGVGGYENTINDLIANAVGSSIAGVLVWLRPRGL